MRGDLVFWCQTNEAFRLNRPFALLNLLRRPFEVDGVEYLKTVVWCPFSLVRKLRHKEVK